MSLEEIIIPEEFKKVIYEFINDIINTFPEYRKNMQDTIQFGQNFTYKFSIRSSEQLISIIILCVIFEIDKIVRANIINSIFV